jgi:hypothetical protein
MIRGLRSEVLSRLDDLEKHQRRAEKHRAAPRKNSLGVQ